MQFKIFYTETGLSALVYRTPGGIRNLSFGHSSLPVEGVVFSFIGCPGWSSCAPDPGCHAAFKKMWIQTLKRSWSCGVSNGKGGYRKPQHHLHKYICCTKSVQSLEVNGPSPGVLVAPVTCKSSLQWSKSCFAPCWNTPVYDAWVKDNITNKQGLCCSGWVISCLKSPCW